jgi:hypothetical protein
VAKALSLKMDERVFQETEQLLEDLPMSRNAYINQAVALLNQCLKRRDLRKQFQRESHLVSQESLQVTREFESLADKISGLD